MRHLTRQFALGALAGIVLSFSISIGLWAVALALMLAAASAWAVRSLALFSGALLGMGFTWIVLGLYGLSRCGQRGVGCGQTDLGPFFAAAAALAAVGLAAGFMALRNR